MKRALVGVLLLGTLTGIPATTGSTSQLVHAPRIHLTHGTSTNWSGYAIETNLNTPQSGAVTDVKGQWVVPSVSCGSTNTYSSNWLGIDGYANNSVEQTGTEQDCSSGRATYYTWYEMYPKGGYYAGLSVSAGQMISAEVKYSGNGIFVLSLRNQNTGQSFSTTQRSHRALRQSAQWIVEAPWSGGVLPLADFGTTSFSNATAVLNGHSGGIGDSAWQHDKITMVTPDGTIKAQPSSLSGSGFSVTWHQS